MVLRVALGLVFLIPVSETVVQARGRVQPSRAEIRSLPILERPNRVGHMYGNSVRRSAHRSGQ